MRKTLFLGSLTIVTMLTMTGCAHKMLSTPATMSYDGSSVDYSKIDSMKHAKVCQDLKSEDSDTSIITATKIAHISKVKHIESSFEYKKFLWFLTSTKKCVTVYGE